MTRKYIKIALPIVIVAVIALATVFLINDTAASKVSVAQIQPTAIILPTATSEPTPEATATPQPTATPEATPTLTPEITATPEPTVEATAMPEISLTPEPTPEATPATPEDVVALGLVSEPPNTGKWIDVNLTDGNTRLMEGRTLIKALPSAFGYGVVKTETDFYATAPGTYYVYTRYNYRWFDAPYSQLWIDSFVGFDGYRANGFHSFLMNENGEVVDSRLGPVSHGCVRVEDWKAVYDFSEIGMAVVVHGKYPTAPIPHYIIKD